MRPAPRKWRRRYGWFESRLIQTLEAAPRRAYEPEDFAAYRYSEANFDSKLLFPPIEERYNYVYVNETLCRQSGLPDFERRFAGTVLAGGHGRIGFRCGRP